MEQNTTDNNPIRILHFSDFHLNGNKINEAQHVLNNMINSLKKINEEKQIDLVIFTGDMLEQGGVGYDNDLERGFADFQSKVINPILTALNLPQERFIFTPGNHDVNRNVDKKYFDNNLSNLSKDALSINDLLKDTEIVEDLNKVGDFKKFEKEYYNNCSDIVYCEGKFVSTFVLMINGYSIGISSLNTVWQCGKEVNNPVLGICQITENREYLQGKDIKIALSHYPHYKLEKEWQDVERLLSKEFDIYFSGHTHSGFNRFLAATDKDYFLDINTEGTLAANIYENDAKYKNAFQIIDYFPRLKYRIHRYFQVEYQNFELDRNGDYSPNGFKELNFPGTSSEIERIKNETLNINREQREAIIKLNIRPFISIKEFIERPNNKVMEGDFIFIPKFEQIKDKLINGNESSIRIMALPGMGKTRIVAEAFRESNDNVYYSPISDCEKALMTLIDECQPKILIIDNCEIEQLAKIQKLVSEFRNDIRIISIYNIPTSTEKGVRLGLYELGYDDTKPVVNAMIERDALVGKNEVIKNRIKYYSGNIPLMAKLLIEAYRKTNTLNIEDPDLVLQHFIQCSETQNNYQIEVLRAISLFEPLGYDGNLQDEFDFLISNDTIHRVPENIEVVKRVFINTIDDFERRELLEHSGGCIRIRPIPLAEWLAAQWIQENDKNFIDIFLQIQNSQQDLGKRLANALKRRFEGMVYNPQAEKLFNYLNDPINGPFHDERIAFSETGSRLFLSMGTVSPVMVAKNIYSLLSVREKDKNWLEENVSNEVRRNLVYALERIAYVSVDAFTDVAKSLLILSSAENESFSNNSTGAFLQLFHILLSGTNAQLSIRAEIFEKNYTNHEYTEIIIRAIDSAFKSCDFTWFDTSGISQSRIEADNHYNPTFKEIHDYWNRCADILISISNSTNDFDAKIMEIINRHISDYYDLNDIQILTKLLDYYGEKCNYDWPELRKTLRLNIKYWSKDNKEKVENSKKWYELFEPKSFLCSVKDSIDNTYHESKENYDKIDENIYSQMIPYAKEFLDKKIYRTNEMQKILKDFEFQTHYYLFVAAVAKELNNSLELIKEIFDSFLTSILNENKQFESPFITQFCSEITKSRDSDIIEQERVFIEELYKKGYYRLSASIEGIIDDENHSLLPKVISNYKKKYYDNYCINNYIWKYSWQNERKDIFPITKELLDEGIDEDEVIFPYFTNGIMLSNIKSIKDENTLSQIERILLSYSFMGKSFRTAYQVVEVMSDILEIHDRPDFALQVHKKIVSVLSSNETTIHDPFDRIYETLLPKYQKVILKQLFEDFAAEDQRINYYWKIHFDLGSSFSFSDKKIGPLFKCDYKYLKEACLKYSKTLPKRMANICPLIESGKEVKDTFFWWLCDNFGDRKDVLNEFSANIESYSYVGGPSDSFANYIESRKNIITPYLQHPNKTVQEWARRQIELIDKEVNYEREQEEYTKMIHQR